MAIYCHHQSSSMGIVYIFPQVFKGYECSRNILKPQFSSHSSKGWIGSSPSPPFNPGISWGVPVGARNFREIFHLTLSIWQAKKSAFWASKFGTPKFHTHVSPRFAKLEGLDLPPVQHVLVLSGIHYRGADDELEMSCGTLILNQFKPN
jgi:hypothetical protein